MRVALLKIPGVESADVSLMKASADIRLKPDNRVTLPQLREVLRKNGYPTRDAEVEARGTIVDRNGKISLDLLNGSALELDATGVNGQPGPSVVEITGVSRADGKAAEKCLIKSIKTVG